MVSEHVWGWSRLCSCSSWCIEAEVGERKGTSKDFKVQTVQFPIGVLWEKQSPASPVTLRSHSEGGTKRPSD